MRVSRRTGSRCSSSFLTRCTSGTGAVSSPSTAATEQSAIMARAPARERPAYWLTRFLILRLLGVVYLVAFLSLAQQVLPLIGEHGLLPAVAFMSDVRAH